MKTLLIICFLTVGCTVDNSWELARDGCLDVAVPISETEGAVCPTRQHFGTAVGSDGKFVLFCKCSNGLAGDIK